jgi:multidrug efflux pump subunit AcrB
LKFPYTFYVLAAFILFLGVSATKVMPEDIFPETNIPVVSVMWQPAPAACPGAGRDVFRPLTVASIDGSWSISIQSSYKPEA